MNDKQAERVRALGPKSLWSIPDGSWLAVRRNDSGTWVEVIDPEVSVLLALDFAADEARVERLQHAVDAAYAAMDGPYVGGPPEREAWQTAMRELGDVVTQHVGQNGTGKTAGGS